MASHFRDCAGSLHRLQTLRPESDGCGLAIGRAFAIENLAGFPQLSLKLERHHDAFNVV
ncbi:hypothetical protein SNOG_05927 [Parastagonospora nodorum SN15]|uniref:Uncharacterized protein n=1 Tax=Phaeosphaeria nodorum (strain SN15 / ATCC MYA-4574 / FGSC 10173) TaxID=321614 RepID=Q0UQN7_PHANO|nr:hypothetical protein SNOG_05927 [Parastagonospora nodorum SN15]EAT86991.1 hypothetical protein SNOG_05927 [Parastagonospora nodorum SN15]